MLQELKDFHTVLDTFEFETNMCVCMFKKAEIPAAREKPPTFFSPPNRARLPHVDNEDGSSQPHVLGNARRLSYTKCLEALPDLTVSTTDPK